MLSRENLWRRLSAADAWPLAWGMAAACALPWLLPERWDGTLPAGFLAAGWLAPLLALGLLRRSSTRWLAAALVLLYWGIAMHARLARCPNREIALALNQVQTSLDQLSALQRIMFDGDIGA